MMSNSSLCSDIEHGAHRLDGPHRPRYNGLLMATKTKTDARIELRELDEQAGRELVDKQARKYLGMSGEEFKRRWEAGEIDADDSPDVMRVAMLLGFAR